MGQLCPIKCPSISPNNKSTVPQYAPKLKCSGCSENLEFKRLYAKDFTFVSSSPICCLIVSFLILSFLDILEDLTLYGHVQRMVEGRLPKIALKWMPKQKGA
jgi:hypothetical protein